MHLATLVAFQTPARKASALIHKISECFSSTGKRCWGYAFGDWTLTIKGKRMASVHKATLGGIHNSFYLSPLFVVRLM